MKVKNWDCSHTACTVCSISLTATRGKKRAPPAHYEDVIDSSSKPWQQDGGRWKDGRNKPTRDASRQQMQKLDKVQLQLRRILALDDHAEQTKRFLEIMGVKVEDILPRGSRDEVRPFAVISGGN